MKRDRIRQTVIDRERKRDRNRERTDRGRERRPERVETGFCHIAMGELYVMAVFLYSLESAEVADFNYCACPKDFFCMILLSKYYTYCFRVLMLV